MGVRKGCCKHYRGTIEVCCGAGVDLRQHVGGDDNGWATRLPCNDRLYARANGPVVPCDKYEDLTAEEIAAAKAAFVAAIARMEKVAPLIGKIKRENKGRSVQGQDQCPACGTGTLHWSHASVNGHVWMRCSTDNCIAFME